jgi:hypothetical protein
VLVEVETVEPESTPVLDVGDLAPLDPLAERCRSVPRYSTASFVVK